MDPFTPVLKRFLEEERHISDVYNSNQPMNKGIKDALRSIRQTREQNKKQILKSNEKLSLRQQYEIIGELKAMPDVKNQIKDMTKTRRLKMQANEYSVKLPQTKSKVFSQFTSSQ
ncbi:unnamed protein product [Rotaria sordida]|nr:unnamed protein product [Rotaria sordida]